MLVAMASVLLIVLIVHVDIAMASVLLMVSVLIAITSLLRTVSILRAINSAPRLIPSEDKNCRKINKYHLIQIWNGHQWTTRKTDSESLISSHLRIPEAYPYF
jgi:hypothetical protein